MRFDTSHRIHLNLGLLIILPQPLIILQRDIKPTIRRVPPPLDEYNTPITEQSHVRTLLDDESRLLACHLAVG